MTTLPPQSLFQSHLLLSWSILGARPSRLSNHRRPPSSRSLHWSFHAVRTARARKTFRWCFRPRAEETIRWKARSAAVWDLVVHPGRLRPNRRLCQARWKGPPTLSNQVRSPTASPLPARRRRFRRLRPWTWRRLRTPRRPQLPQKRPQDQVSSRVWISSLSSLNSSVVHGPWRRRSPYLPQRGHP